MTPSEFGELPKIDNVIAGLKPKVEAELGSEMAAQFFQNLDEVKDHRDGDIAFNKKAQMLLNLPKWKLACARYLWLNSIRYLNSNEQYLQFS